MSNITTIEAEGLAARGHEVTVLATFFGAAAPREEVHNGVRIHRFDIRGWHGYTSGEKKEYKDAVLRYARDVDVMVNVCIAGAITTDLALECFPEIACKKVLYSHGVQNRGFHVRYLYKPKELAHFVWGLPHLGPLVAREKKYYSMYDLVIQLHQEEAAYHFFKKKYDITSEVIENAVEDRFWTEPSSGMRIMQYAPDFPQKYFICVANYFRIKQQAEIVKAFALSGVGDEYGLVLIGSSKKTDYYLKVAAEIEKAKAAGVHVLALEGVDRADTIEMVQQAYGYLMYSIEERYPVSIAEAMASGVPYICSNVGIVRFLPGGHVVSTIEAMAAWIRLYCRDPELAQATGECGRLYAKKNLRREIMVGKLEEYLKEVVEGKKEV